MSDLRDILARLGLSQYFDALVAEGFDSWETVLDITESDLSQLNVKLGHRRKLQRAIAESRGQSADRPLPVALRRATSVEGSYRSDDSGPESKSKQGESSVVTTTGPGTKRKYRRHPKPDEHAPERPPSAYVIFSNQVRESLKGQDLTFTEIAKVVGERWQVLPSDQRETCERQANSAKEKFYSELAEYKKTPHFEAYQKYLEEFRAKHAPPTKEGKRSRLETETPTSTRSNSNDQLERAALRRLSSTQPDTSAMLYQRIELSPLIGPARLPAAPPFSSKPTSPTALPLPGMQSPRSSDYYHAVSASPRAAGFPREPYHDPSASNAHTRDTRSSTDTSLPYHPSTLPDPHRQPPFTQSPAYPYPIQYQSNVDRSSRRPLRDGARLPGLSHEDTTLSSESSHSNYGYPLTSQLPLTDPGKSSRTLPQPLPPILPSRSPSDPLSAGPPPALAHQTQDYRTQGPLAVLLRAGEMASRASENEPMEEGGSP
ncbi:hypothetical protein IQ07DRAFT_641719 [Pyrenochaeta sp. DS3sAY3a]|nr:hypothetical protein IQ07DRAFT_641719 [Pyrenochaeta sp. DS3sAY3a]